MNSSIAIYPSVQWRQQTVLWSDYLEKAGKYGFRETIFYKGIMPSETGFRFSSGL